jgi:hypothetical protein
MKYGYNNNSLTITFPLLDYLDGVSIIIIIIIIIIITTRKNYVLAVIKE